MPPVLRPPSALRAFLDNQASGGIVLMGVAVLALVVANSPAAELYFSTLEHHILGLSVLHWINDALMAVFFLLVGLEIKREMVDGQLSTWSRRILPGVAALGGMVVPALIYVFFNRAEGGHLEGWAIPSATDIAFALGVATLLGPRVPASLKVFLAALAIIDDLGAVIIIAVFYTGGLNLYALGGAALIVGILVTMNRVGVKKLTPYLGLGVCLWVLIFLSGVHATLAGVILALTIPLTRTPGHPDDAASPLHRLEHAIQPAVTFLIVPVFGFANAGVSFFGLTPSALLDPVTLGVLLGLFFGKQIGVFTFSWACIKAGLTDLPANATWPQLYGVALLCGIGFTMSLFIGLLAFPGTAMLQGETKLGVIVGSILSGILGTIVLSLTKRPEHHP
jgi:NhaA family Na+:H+ antiporter